MQFSFGPGNKWQNTEDIGWFPCYPVPIYTIGLGEQVWSIESLIHCTSHHTRYSTVHLYVLLPHAQEMILHNVSLCGKPHIITSSSLLTITLLIVQCWLISNVQQTMQSTDKHKYFNLRLSLTLINCTLLSFRLIYSILPETGLGRCAVVRVFLVGSGRPIPAFNKCLSFKRPFTASELCIFPFPRWMNRKQCSIVVKDNFPRV